MKQMYITRLFSWIAGLSAFGGLCACSGDEEGPQAGASSEPVVSVVLDSPGAAADGLDISVYIFEKASGDSRYVFKSSLNLQNQQGKMRWNGSELLANDYRFLFLATPSAGAQLAVKRSDGQIPAAGTFWEEILLDRVSAPLSGNNYYQVKDLSGQEILASRTVRARLERVVGQVVFDFFKTAPTGSPTPVDIDAAAGVTSVLDRVYRIDITYPSSVRQLAFEGTALKPLAGSRQTETQTVMLPEEPDLRVTVPRAEIGLLRPYEAAGCARIAGYFCLPTAENMPVALTFYYYDTTPVCQSGGSAGHVHDSKCYASSRLQLNLRDADGAPVVGVRPGYLTVNKGAILYDRIIDVPASSAIRVDFDWNLENLKNQK